MLLAEDLLLLVTDDATGRLIAPAVQVDIGLGGANLIELALMRKVDLSGPGDTARPGRIMVRDASPAGDPVLDQALAILDSRPGGRPAAVLRSLHKRLRPALYQRLADGGMVQPRQARALGVFPTTNWPAANTGHKGEVARLVTQVLVGQAQPDTHSAALIALLHALKREHKIVDPDTYGLTKQDLRARAGEIAQCDWASEAVREAIAQLVASVASASTAALAASSG